jgi:hypothetical protein
MAALKHISDIAERVNQSIKAEENYERLCIIQKSFVGNVKVGISSNEGSHLISAL